MLLLALGEEIGWRGFLLPVIRRRLRFWPANLIVAAGWAAMHLPLVAAGVIGGTAASLAYRLIWFIVNIGLFSVVLGAAWEVTHDVWTATLAHGLWNVVVGDVLATASAGASPWIAGETGYAPAIGLILVLPLLLRLSRRRRSAPLRTAAPGRTHGKTRGADSVR